MLFIPKRLYYFTLSIVFFTLISSCSKKYPHAIGLIPKDASLVAQVNTKELIKDNFFDLIGAADLFQSFDQPSDIGIKKLDDAFLFLLGEQPMNISIGGILSVDDKDKLLLALNQNNLELIEENSISFLKLNPQFQVGIHKEVAVFMYAPFGTNKSLKAQINNCFLNWLDETNKHDKNVFNGILNQPGHLKIWGDEYKLSTITNTALKLLNKKPFNNLESTKGNFLFTSLDFKKGAINVLIKKIYNQESFDAQQELKINNHIDKISNTIHPSSAPIGMSAISLNVKEMRSIFNQLAKDDGFKNWLNHKDINQVLSSLSGNVFLSYYGLHEYELNLIEPVIDYETGDYYEEKVLKKILAPSLVISAEVLDNEKLTKVLKKLNPLFNQKEEAFVLDNSKIIGLQNIQSIIGGGLAYTLRDGNLYFGMGTEGVEVIKNSGNPPSFFTNEWYQNTHSLWLDLNTFTNNIQPIAPYDLSLINNYFSEISIVSKYPKDLEKVSSLKITTKRDESSLITLAQFFQELQNKWRNLEI